MLEHAQKVHFLGLDATLTGGMAQLLRARGLQVSGTAPAKTPRLELIRRSGVDVFSDHNAENLDGVDLVVTSPGVSATNAELLAAEERGIAIVDQADLLQELVDGRRTIAVTGTHGRGTVASLVAWILECAGEQPGFIIGGQVNNFERNTREARPGSWMVLEIAEHDKGMERLKVDYVVCNFLEVEHLGQEQALDDAITDLVRFLETNERLKEVFVNLDCQGNRQLVAEVALRPTGYSLGHHSEFRGRAIHDDPARPILKFEASRREAQIGEFDLPLAGQHNIVNALGAIAVAYRLGIAPEVIARALASFRGVRDRFVVAHGGGVTVIKDSSRSPAAISKVISAAQTLTDGRLFAVLKPPRFTPRDYLEDGYGHAFRGCEEVVVTSMEQPRSESGDGQSAAPRKALAAPQAVAESIRSSGPKALYIAQASSVQRYLLERLEADDEVVFFGDEDVFRQADLLQAALAARAAATKPQPTQPRMDGPLVEGDDQ